MESRLISPAAGATMAGKTRVMFVDDDALSLQLMAKVSMLLGFEAIVTTSARRGLNLAAAEQPAIIIVDMQMDEMNGIDFVRQVRSSPEIAHLPVLLCSAGMSTEDERLALESGADDYLRKPVSLDLLRQAVQKHVSDGHR